MLKKAAEVRMKAIVVDDEELTALHISKLLEKQDIDVLGYFINPHEGMEAITRQRPDVVFLDIEMAELDGLEMAEKIQSGAHECEIVFITAYNQYAIEAFSVNALDYLLKPVTAAELARAVERARKRRLSISPTALAHEGSNPSLRIGLFGHVYLYINGRQEPVRWLTVKCAEIFAFMLLHRDERELSKGKLMEAIWPDKDREKAYINLRSTISRLNKTLRENGAGIAVISGDNGYQLSCGGAELEVDAFRLERLALGPGGIDSAGAEVCYELLTSCRGMLLEDFEGEWCLPLRLAYQRYFIGMAQKLLMHYEAMNEAPLKLLNITERLIDYEPYDEKLREKVLMLHFSLEGWKGAEKYYKEYKKLLQKELGIGPGETLRRLHYHLARI